MSRFTLRLAIALQAAISAGDGLALIALANRVYQSSHASWAVAAVFLALTVPITTLAPVAGLERRSPGQTATSRRRRGPGFRPAHCWPGC